MLGIAEGFVKGWTDRDNELSRRRLDAARLFATMRQQDPTASLQTLQGFAEQSYGSDAIYGIGAPTGQMLQDIARQNEERRINQEQSTRLRTMSEQMQLQGQINQMIEQYAPYATDGVSLRQAVVGAFGGDPRMSEQIDRMIPTQVWDTQLQRGRDRAVQEALPRAMEALRQGVDISSSLPPNTSPQIRQQIERLARERYETERQETTRRTVNDEVNQYLRRLEADPNAEYDGSHLRDQQVRDAVLAATGTARQSAQQRYNQRQGRELQVFIDKIPANVEFRELIQNGRHQELRTLIASSIARIMDRDAKPEEIDDVFTRVTESARRDRRTQTEELLRSGSIAAGQRADQVYTAERQRITGAVERQQWGANHAAAKNALDAILDSAGMPNEQAMARMQEMARSSDFANLARQSTDGRTLARYFLADPIVAAGVRDRVTWRNERIQTDLRAMGIRPMETMDQFINDNLSTMQRQTEQARTEITRIVGQINPAQRNSYIDQRIAAITNGLARNLQQIATFQRSTHGANGWMDPGERWDDRKAAELMQAMTQQANDLVQYLETLKTQGQQGVQPSMPVQPPAAPTRADINRQILQRQQEESDRNNPGNFDREPNLPPHLQRLEEQRRRLRDPNQLR